ncbi:MAG: GGDEF domain-containing protein [Desulfuromonadaceae bacterium]
MSLTTYLVVFGSGLTAGMLIIFFTNKLSSGDSSDLFGGIGRLLSMLTGSGRRTPKTDTAQEENRIDLLPPVDPREQRLYDSSQAIRNMLLVLAANIQRTDKAASDSTHMLGDVKNVINTMELPPDLSQAHSLLMKEIDSVISSNAALKDELAKSHAVLSERQDQIENLRTAVRIDGLTQVGNRAYFDEKLIEIISLRKRYGDTFALMMIDIDHFKTANDTYGHQAGDRILKGVALKLKASLRGSDFLARFGGDEFAIILFKSDIAAATEVAWKLSREVQTSRFILDNESLSVTLSIGVAEARADDTSESLLKRADAALYRTKIGGRNGVSADGA